MNINTQQCYTNPVTSLPPQIRHEVRQFANATNDLAERILMSESQNSAPRSSHTTVHHHYHDSPSWYWRPWGYSRTVYVAPSCPSSCESSSSSKKSDSKNDKDKDNTALYVLAGTVAAVVGLCTLFSSGATVGKFNNDAAELEETRKLKAKLLECQNLGAQDQKIVNVALKTIAIKEQLCQRMTNSSVDDWHNQLTLLLGCGSGVAGAGIGLAGVTALGVATAPVLIAGGAIAGTIAACRMLFKSGFDSTNNQNIRDANDLRLSVALLRHEINA